MHKKISGVILDFEERVKAKNAAITSENSGQTKEEHDTTIPETNAHQAEDNPQNVEAATQKEDVPKVEVTTPKEDIPKAEANTPVENMPKVEANVSEGTQSTKITTPEESTQNASPQNITDVSEKENLNFEEMTNLISQIEDEETKKAQMKKLLEALYNFDTDSSKFSTLQQENTPNDYEIATVILNAQKVCATSSREIDDLIRRIAAKQIAINNKRFGCIIATGFKDISQLQYITMLENDMPKIIAEESEKLYPTAKLEVGTIKTQLLGDLGNEIAQAANESDEHNITIPQKRCLHDLTQEERDSFINAIVSKLNDGIDKENAKKKIAFLLNLPLEDVQSYKERIDATLQEMTEKDAIGTLKLVDKIASDFSQDPSLIDTMSNLYQATTKIPTQDKEATLNAVTKTINQRFDPFVSRAAL